MIAPRRCQDATLIGCDVGSTAVKVVVVDAATNRVVTRRYSRHGTRQVEGTVRLLRELDGHHPGLLERSRIFFTGSGGRPLADRSGCRYVQEVNAVALAVEQMHPEAGSIVDIGGQDAKVIIWQVDQSTGHRRKIFSMNDKCAGGTGSVIDRIAAKLGLPADALTTIHTDGLQVHPVAARCGVFAETDINSLQKQGVPPAELLASLFEAIVQQNLSVLTRGASLQPPLLLLGGPHAYLPGLVDVWRRAVTTLWRERGIALPEDLPPSGLVQVPANACFFPSLGAVIYGRTESTDPGPWGDEILERLELSVRRSSGLSGDDCLLESATARQEIAATAQQSEPGGFPVPVSKIPGDLPELDVVIGLDAGSTSTKAVALDLAGNLLAKAYNLSAGDPLDDARLVLEDLESKATTAGWTLKVRRLGVTGYAKDLLSQFLGADLMLVETVAHTRSALQIDPSTEVIVDIGGQDIKVMILREGRVRDFRLNSQCSAGNGYFLQSTASRFNIPLSEFADRAFSAKRSPRFHVGCAVFLESDIVNFQQIGWQPEEILAGLVRVLPRNVWFYVVGEPNLERLGKRYLLQGGTQRNEAAVKAQVDFIRQRVPGAKIRVHPHAGESGAIGVALELLNRSLEKPTQFLGFDEIHRLEVRSRQDEATRCQLCPNRCLRTVLEATTTSGDLRRFVVAGCEAGRDIDGDIRARKQLTTEVVPDFSAQEARDVFHRQQRVPIGVARKSDITDRWGMLPWLRSTRRRRQRRELIRIGIPRALNLYQTAPFFIAYFQALGIDPERINVSGVTTESLFRRGVKRGAIDNCFPSKVALAHVHDLVRRRNLDWIFFPILINLPQVYDQAIDSMVCPSSQATPEVIKAAFTREENEFSAGGKQFLNPVFNMGEPALFERQMFKVWKRLLGVSRAENQAAINAANQAWGDSIRSGLRAPALAEIRRLEESARVGIVVLGRPYHNDPGLNHNIFQDLNRLGYPIFSISSLPHDPIFLSQLFAEEIAQGKIKSPFDISDVWPHTFSANSNAKLWAAKVVARHPNLVGLDVSSFRCGHDAPIYATVEKIMEVSQTPYFTFHEIDENRASGAIRLRVETIDYFLREYQQSRLQKYHDYLPDAGDHSDAARQPQRHEREASYDR